MDAVLLDTDVFSYLLRTGDKRADAYRQHVQGKTIAASFVTVGELYFGAIKKGWSPKTLASLEQKLKTVVIVPYDIEICRTYARLRATLKTATGTHRSIGSNDFWIAACAIRHGIPLITNNIRHFEGIPDLQVISEAPKAKHTIGESGKLFDGTSPNESD